MKRDIPSGVLGKVGGALSRLRFLLGTKAAGEEVDERDIKAATKSYEQAKKDLDRWNKKAA